MTTYNVHIYREMKLLFSAITADTHEAAASIARDKPTGDAVSIDDCDGEIIAALVDMVGDENYSQSVTIDFEPERQRKAAPKLLAALKLCHERLGHWLADTETCDLSPEDEEALTEANHAIAEAEAVCIASEPLRKATPDLRAALTWLLDDLTDAAEDRNPKTGEEYDSVAFARAALANSTSAGIASQPAVSRLLAACRMVVERWESGDLAEAARACSAAIAEAEATAVAPVPPAGAVPAKRPYSVLLLYPDYANDGGNETYYAFVEALDPNEAIVAAKRQALAAQEGVIFPPDDFAPLLVTQGHNYGQPISNY